MNIRGRGSDVEVVGATGEAGTGGWASEEGLGGVESATNRLTGGKGGVLTEGTGAGSHDLSTIHIASITAHIATGEAGMGAVSGGVGGNGVGSSNTNVILTTADRVSGTIRV